MSAIYSATGHWKAKSDSFVTRVASSLWACASISLSTLVHHVKSHSGNPVNEVADSICTATSR
eukprot:9737858-Karenia_brevis.AAC.1